MCTVIPDENKFTKFEQNRENPFKMYGLSHIKGNLTHLQPLQISVKFRLQVASDIRRIL